MFTQHAALALLVICAACHHDHAVKTTPVPPATAAAPAPAKPAPQPVAVSTNLVTGDDVARACQLHFANEPQAPKFDFDKFELTTQDRNVLQQIADCITRGPLKGHKLALVGRADPRGTEEYNLGLGDRRANSVGTYLEHLGVAATAIRATTRGALDAHGHDDDSWRVDRRVDVELD
jgi:outer membrane protein OmpA-like peptidoglycan-associated protein